MQPIVTDPRRRRSAIQRLGELNVSLPTFNQLADGADAPVDVAGVDPDAADAANLWRVHWYNDADRRHLVATPGHVVLPRELTGVDAPIVVLLGRRFPLIGAHKVLAAYACLVPRLVSGQFDPSIHRAVWPSTGNFCRGGVAISRILGCHGVAVLPTGMSRERFDWLRQWVSDPADIIRTPGTESNVKEIYDKCAELAADEDAVILNQFAEFANYLIHYLCTGRAVDRVFTGVRAQHRGARLAAFVSATGSAGTIAAGDYLKTVHGSRTVAVEALECPTLLCNGYGEHNIQGIGDKHIPLIHNVMNTDVAIGVSDAATDALNHLFASDVGRRYLTRRRNLPPALVEQLAHLGISGLANILASIKLARHLDYGEDDVVMTVATDSADLYASERDAYAAKKYPGGFDEVNAGETFGRNVDGVMDDHVLELQHRDRLRIFNLGYYTWVEQQGVSVEDFDRRRDQRFWQGLVDTSHAWDQLIDEFNAEVGHVRRRHVS